VAADPTTRFSPTGSSRRLAQQLCASGNQIAASRFCDSSKLRHGAQKMNGIIYLVGLVVVVLAILSFFGLR
jgi:hypothetical protein